MPFSQKFKRCRKTCKSCAHNCYSHKEEAPRDIRNIEKPITESPTPNIPKSRGDEFPGGVIGDTTGVTITRGGIVGATACVGVAVGIGIRVGGEIGTEVGVTTGGGGGVAVSET